MLQCPDCGDVEVVSDTSGSEKCRVCAKCGLVLGSDGNFNHISTDGNTTDEQFDVDSLTKVSMELDSRMRYAQRQNYKSQTIGMPSSTRFAAQKVAKDQRKDQNVKADRHVTGKSTRAHKEIFNASRKWLLGKDITGMTIELFDKLIASKKAGSITYDKLAIACLYSVSKSAAVAPPLAEAASLAGVDLHRFGAYLKKVKVFQLKSNELTNE